RDNPDLWLQPVMLVTGRKIRAQSVVLVQHSGLGELGSVERLGRADRVGLVVLPAAQKKPPPSTRPGGVRVAKCLTVNRDTRNVPPTTTCAVPPNEGSRRQKTPPSSRTWAMQAFQSASLVVNEGETQRCRRSASREEDALRVYA